MVSVAVQAQAVVGFLVAWLVADEVQLLELVVQNSARRQRVGTSLLLHLREALWYG